VETGAPTRAVRGRRKDAGYIGRATAEPPLPIMFPVLWEAAIAIRSWSAILVTGPLLLIAPPRALHSARAWLKAASAASHARAGSGLCCRDRSPRVCMRSVRIAPPQ